MFDANKYSPLNTGFNGKMKPQSNGGRKNRSAQMDEHLEALLDNVLYNMSIQHKDQLVKDPTDGSIHVHDLVTDASVIIKE